MKHVFKLLKCFLILFFVISMSSCGKMSDPKPIENSGYPHMYPKI